MTSLLFRTVVASLLCFLAFADKELPKDFAELANRTRTTGSWSTESSACPQTSYFISSTGQTTNLLRIKTVIPDLNEFTMCAWVTRYYDPDVPDPTMISYANSVTPYAIVVRFESTTTTLALNNNWMTESLTFPANEEHHICFATFFNTTGFSYMFVDGVFVDIFHGNSGTIKGGGVFLLGNMQTSLGYIYTYRNSAQGAISNFMIWDRILDFAEYSKMYQNRCYCPPGHKISLEPEKVQIYNGAVNLIPPECPSSN